MADATTQPVAEPTPQEPAATTAAAPGTYAMSRDGRRQAIVLLLGVISIWVFALWTLITTLDAGLSGAEWVTAALMLAVLLVAPLVGWTLLEEANARYTVSPDALTYSTVGGINLRFAWSDIQGIKPKDAPGRLARFFLGDDAPALAEPEAATPAAATEPAQPAPEETEPDGEPRTVLLGLSTSPSAQIANPVVRFLHKQAHGDALPVYGGLDNQQTLLDEIASRIQPT
ncbi:MAG TPA: hypothetical protein VFR15_01570 [Chloroflexia bacterium]|nr:hypothetical protein [Chloroflexia bacterium]